jgi:peptidoglycan/xylan/chitin deacetylase (PgdA/CDA1 family)
MRLFKNTIINFHGIKNIRWFESVLTELLNIYNLVPIHEIDDYFYKGTSPRSTCHLTFDDGDVSFYLNVFPLLKKFNIPVSLYVSPYMAMTGNNFWFQEIRGYDLKRLKEITLRIINRRSENNIAKIPLKYILKSIPVELIYESIRLYQKETGTPPKKAMNMNVEQILELNKSGLVEVGAHTQTHPVLKNETEEKTKTEIKDSIYQLSDILGEKVRYFAYPNGDPEYDFGKREMSILSEIGIRLAFSTKTACMSKYDNPLSIPRNGLSYGNKYFMLSKLIMGTRWSTAKKIFHKEKYRLYRDIIDNNAFEN